MTIADLEFNSYSNANSILPSLVHRATATMPAALTTLANVTVATAGLYEITNLCRYGPTGDVSDNMGLYVNDVLVTTLPVIGMANSVPVPFVFTRRFAAGDTIKVKNIAAGAVASVYISSLILNRKGA